MHGFLGLTRVSCWGGAGGSASLSRGLGVLVVVGIRVLGFLGDPMNMKFLRVVDG